MPFSLGELEVLSRALRDACIGIIELAHPETRPEVREEYRLALQSVGVVQRTCSQSQLRVTQLMWRRLFKVSCFRSFGYFDTCLLYSFYCPLFSQVLSQLVKQLYDRDSRRKFCPDKHWLSHHIDIRADQVRLPNSVKLLMQHEALYVNLHGILSLDFRHSSFTNTPSSFNRDRSGLSVLGIQTRSVRRRVLFHVVFVLHRFSQLVHFCSVDGRRTTSLHQRFSKAHSFVRTAICCCIFRTYQGKHYNEKIVLNVFLLYRSTFLLLDT